MNRTDLFALAELGIGVAGFALFSFLYRKSQDHSSHFRDDLWTNSTKAKQRLEEKIDERIRLEHKAPATEPKEESAKAQTPRAPNFRGKAHEVLGVSISSSEQEILAAYKYWIKRYHPDRVTHLGEKYVEQARRRAEQLNAARDFLLKKRS